MRYIARQPIFDLQKQVVGYELLFRRSRENVYDGDDPETATKASIDAALLVGIETFTNGGKIFVNCTKEAIVNGYATLFPPDRTVIEVLESVEPDSEVFSACERLKGAGYAIALDDFKDGPKFADLAELSDIIKVDFRSTVKKTRRKLLDRYLSPSRTMLAEKVETPEEYESAVREGFRLFQGFFFSRPVMLTARQVAGSRLSYLRLMKEIHAPETDLKQLEQIIKSEPALCYRLLRYFNSPSIGLRGRITSILQGLTMLGELEFRKWLTVTCAVLATEGKPRELVNTALVRARFCELAAAKVNFRPADAFITGLFSLMDAVMDTPMQHLLSLITLPPAVLDTLLGKPGRLTELLKVVLAYEAGDWANVTLHARNLSTTEQDVASCYVEAVSWVGGTQA